LQVICGAKYPFLLFETDQEAARAWFLATPFAKWPIKGVVRFVYVIVKLLAGNESKVAIGNFEQVERLAWPFVVRHGKMFTIGAILAIGFFARVSGVLRGCRPAIDMLSIAGWSLSSAMEVLSAFCRATEKIFEASESVHLFKVQDLRQLADLFLLNP
jgi:hypothetical protein